MEVEEYGEEKWAGQLANRLSEEQEKYEQDVKRERDDLAVRVLCSALLPAPSSASNSAMHLVCGANSGHINIWNISSILSSRLLKRAFSEAPPFAPYLSVAAHKGPVYAAQVVSNTHLITAGDDCIHVWDWDALAATPLSPASSPTPSSSASTGESTPHSAIQQTFVNPQTTGARHAALPIAETNDICYDAQSSTLFSAAGDGNCYKWDMTKGVMSGTLSGHEDAVYAVRKLRDSQLLVSSSEDGTVRLWDLRDDSCTKVLDPSSGKVYEPSESKRAAAPWVSALDVDETGMWMVCGGGARYSTLWHMQSLAVVAALPTPGNVQSVRFTDDRILTVGNESNVSHWTRQGKLKHRVQTRSTSLFSVNSVMLDNTPAVVTTGNSLNVDVFIQPTTMAFTCRFLRA